MADPAMLDIEAVPSFYGNDVFMVNKLEGKVVELQKRLAEISIIHEGVLAKVLAKKETVIAQKETVIAQKEDIICSLDKTIAGLKKQLGDLKKQREHLLAANKDLVTQLVTIEKAALSQEVCELVEAE